MSSNNVAEEKGAGRHAEERFFSVELESRSDLKNVTLSDGSGGVLVEGSLGELVHAAFAEGMILEVVGKRGVLRVDLTQDEVKYIMKAEES